VEIVVPKELEAPACRDPDDDWILATAIAGDAECIVTGDKDFLTLGHHRGVEIIGPSAFSAFELGSPGAET